MARNDTLRRAKKAKEDEFYTQLTDINNELENYTQHFNGKTVLCNCDDPYESNFFKYFALKFNDLHLKRLICTCWDGSPIAQKELMKNSQAVLATDEIVMKRHFDRQIQAMEAHERKISSILSRNEGFWISNFWAKVFCWVILVCFLLTFIAYHLKTRL